MSDASRVQERALDLIRENVERDAVHHRVSMVRAGKMHLLFPEQFSEDLPQSTVANLVDTAAKDLAEVMAPLPSLACASGSMETNADKKRASKKNQIGTNYWIKSRLSTQQLRFADMYNTYGFGVYTVEPDFETNTPLMRVEDSRGFYWRRDRGGNVYEALKVTSDTVGRLVAMYPQFKQQLTQSGRRAANMLLTVHTWWDMDQTVAYVPMAGNVVLGTNPNLFKGRIGVTVADHYSGRGQFDDVIYVQLAKAIMGQFMLQAADKSINAPLAVPRDVQEVSYGPDAVMVTDNPGSISRVHAEIPRDVFQFAQTLDGDLRDGARYPDARTGGVKGSVITGRGVEAMLGTFDTQIKTAQDIFQQALNDATSMCFELDDKLFGGCTKEINGIYTGQPYQLTYTPNKDIAGKYDCMTTFGFAAGLSPSQAIVMLLQLRGDDTISRDTLRRQLPFSIDPEKEQRDLDTQKMTDALEQGFAAMLQAMGPMIQQGQDPHKMLVQAATAIHLRSSGKSLAEALMAAMAPPPPDPTAPPVPGNPGNPVPDGQMPGNPGAPGGPPGAPGGDPTLPGVAPSGLPTGVAPGQQGEAPGGRPGLQQLIAGFRGGQAQMSAVTKRQNPLS
jgi:hypothetical protein